MNAVVNAEAGSLLHLYRATHLKITHISLLSSCFFNICLPHDTHDFSMATSKVINLYFSPTRYTATISSDMDDDTLYQVFRATIAEITDPSLHIIVTNKRGEKVQLHYESLHSGALYYIATSSERMQGAGTSSTAASKTVSTVNEGARRSSRVFSEVDLVVARV
jgi:hypothetical protein